MRHATALAVAANAFPPAMPATSSDTQPVLAAHRARRTGILSTSSVLNKNRARIQWKRERAPSDGESCVRPLSPMPVAPCTVRCVRTFRARFYSARGRVHAARPCLALLSRLHGSLCAGTMSSMQQRTTQHDCIGFDRPYSRASRMPLAADPTICDSHVWLNKIPALEV